MESELTGQNENESAEIAKKKLCKLLSLINRPGIGELIEYLLDNDFFIAPCSTEYHLNIEGGLVIHSWNVTKIFKDLCIMFNIGDDQIPVESQTIIPAFHDICKMNFYKEGGKPASPEQWKYLINLWDEKHGIVQRFHPEDSATFINTYITKNESGFMEIRKDMSADHASPLIDWLKNRPGQPMPKDLPKSWSVDDQFPIGHGEKSVIMLQEYIKLTKSEILAIRWHMAPFDAGIHFPYPTGYAYRKAQEEPAVTLLQAADMLASKIVEVKTDGK
ncbi:MAG TPA: hypothetical protein DDW65_21695 [Firmicutes bacterium]|jgi:hypothetical protein|nr:hypothetical protein [Bacillota bacterium]